MAVCPTCSGTTVCGNCGGQGREECTTCNGVGKLTMLCGRCGGTGSEPNSSESCLECGGTGNTRQECSSCNGAGSFAAVPLVLEAAIPLFG